MYDRITEVWRYRAMLWSLILSELRTRYKGSFFGFLWTFINPVLTLVVYSLIFSLILRVTVPHYAAYMFIGLLAWNAFSTGVLSSSSVVVRQGSLVKKIYFPREILPLSVVGGAVINYAFSLIILLPFLMISGFRPTVLWLFLPVIIVALTLFTTGLAMICSAINVYVRDLEHMLGIFFMLWFYLTPVVYSIDLIPKKYIFGFKLNPVGDIVLSLQAIFYYNTAPHWKLLLYCFVVSVLVLVLGWKLFTSLSKRFAEEV